MAIQDALTPQQHATIFASAGSGKTWLLVSRIIRLLLAGAPAERILAVTFTRKAAAEMETRLSERLGAWLALDDQHLRTELESLGVKPDTGLLEKARRLYETLLFSARGVRATTFHALCQDILRRFPLEAGVPTGFELIETTWEIRHQAWDALAGAATRKPDGALARALQTLFDTCNGAYNAEAALNEFLDHRSDWWAYTEDQEAPVDYAAARTRTLLDVRPDEQPLADFLDASTRARLQRFAALLAMHATPTNVDHARELDAALDGVFDHSAFERIRRVFLTEKNTPRARGANKRQTASMGAAEAEFLRLHDTLSADILRTIDRLARVCALTMSGAWYIAGSEYLAHYQRLKQARRTLDFTDLEWSAYQLLHRADNAHWIQYKLDQRIDHFLIDEFQDTNPTQWHLLLPLLEELSHDDSGRGRSVFLVGDSKQSIYGFRRARPELQALASQWLTQTFSARSYTQAESWRSSPAIMDFVNRVFGHGELAQLLDPFPRHHARHQTLWGRVEVLPLVTPAADTTPGPPTGLLRNPLEQARVIADTRLHYHEGRRLARRISALIDAPTLIGAEADARALQYHDILILLRSRTHVADIEQALREQGIPCLSADQGTLLDNLEILDMVALLEALITPYNNLALAQILKSPMFGVTDEDLLRLARHGAWIERLTDVAADLPARHALVRAATYLSRWRALAGQIPIHDLLDRVFAEVDVMGRYAAASTPWKRAQVSANLTRFLDLALEIDSGRYPSLVNFIERLRSAPGAGREAPDAPPARSGSRVRIMTIHGAKGLEAPVVFLVDSAASNQRASAYQALVDWPAAAARPAHMLLRGRRADMDSATRELQNTAALAEEREYANLLYVAVTRARQILIISGCEPPRKDEQNWYRWIDAALDADVAANDVGVRIIEHGSAPRTVTPMEEQTPRTSDADHRLAAPVSLAAAELTVAPSHQIDTGGVVRHGDDDALQRGIVIHRILELLTDDATITDEALRNRIATELRIDSTYRPLRAWLAEGRRVVGDAALTGLFDPRRYRRACNEVPLQYREDDQQIVGVIDRLVELHNAELLVIDYKTHQHANTETIPEIARTYARQMDYYVRGVCLLWPGRTVRGALLFTACRELHRYPPSLPECCG